MKLATAEIMRELDRKAIEEYGLPGMVLMENAARGTVCAMIRHFPDLLKRQAGILAGRGNNGGDALAIARYLLNRGAAPKVYLLADRKDMKGDGAANLEILTRMGGTIFEVRSGKELAARKEEVAGSDILIDGIFGTGLNAPVRGFCGEFIDFVNSLGRPVVSIDLPSGLDANTGQILGTCIRAHLTVTYGLAKRGLVVQPGASCCGTLMIVDISLPRSLVEAARFETTSSRESNFHPFFARGIPMPIRGTSVISWFSPGSVGKTGAAAMVCQAAMRSGAGLVTLGIPESLNDIMEVKLTETMTEPLPESKARTLGLGAFSRIFGLCQGKDALVIGPGLSTHRETGKLVARIVQTLNLPMVIDADGLNALAGKTALLRKAEGPVILMPHPGEMARLAGKTTREVQQNRIETARGFAAKNRVILVLKGARTLVLSPEGDVFINPTGNPGMASGGMGDVLTGMVGGFLSQGFPPLTSAKLGVYLHGLLGDFAAHKKGGRGIIATDLVDEIPRGLRALADGTNSMDDFSYPLQMETCY